MVLLVVAIAEFITTFMVSAVSIALPSIGDEWLVSPVALGWIALAYMLTLAALLMPAGRMADLFGRKRFFVMGLAVFTIFSFACALAPFAPVLIVLRALQGAGVALMYACTVAMVTLAYPPESRGRALGLQVTGVYLGFTLGPVLGGVIVGSGSLGWRWLFVLVGVLGVLNLALAVWGLRGVEWRESKGERFDLIGSVGWATALTLFLLGLTLLPAALGWVLTVVGIGGIVGFMWWEARITDPVLNVDLFRQSRVFTFSNAAILVNYSATFAVTFLLSLYLQDVRGMSAEATGLVLVGGMLIQAVLSPLAGLAADRGEARYVAAAGGAVCVCALGALVFIGEATPRWYVITAVCVLGVGFTFFATPIIHAIMGSVTRRYAGVSSATVGTTRTTGQNISLALATLLLSVFVGSHPITPADYSQLLTGIRVTFAIMTVLCLLGLGATLVGPRKQEVSKGGDTSAEQKLS
jgi:MFS family permease